MARLLHVEAARLSFGPGSRRADRVVLRAEPVDPPALSCRRSPGAAPSEAGGRGQLAWRSSECASRSPSTTTSASSSAASAATPCSGRCCEAPRLPSAAPALALGGARLGGGRAADRGRPSGPDPAPHRRPLGAAAGQGREALRDVPAAATIAGRAPAELAAMDLAPKRAIALRRVAREVARAAAISAPGRRSPPACDPRDRPLDGPAVWACSVAATWTRFRPAISPT